MAMTENADLQREIVENPNFKWKKGTVYRRRQLASAIVWVLYEHGPIRSKHVTEDLHALLRARGVHMGSTRTAQLAQLRMLLKAMSERNGLGEWLAREVSGSWTKGIALHPNVRELPPCPFSRDEDPGEEEAVLDGRQEPEPEPELGPELQEAGKLAAPTVPAAEEDAAAQEGTDSPLVGLEGSAGNGPVAPGPVPHIQDELPVTLTPEEWATSPEDKIFAAMALLNAAVVQPRQVLAAPSPVAVEPDPSLVERLATALEDAQRLRQKYREAQDINRAKEEQLRTVIRANRQLEANIDAMRRNGPAANDAGYKTLKRFMEEKPRAKA